MASSSFLRVSERSRLVTLLLSLLICLGMCGVHRIYAGKVVTGVIQFLTAGLCGIWQIIDIILILLGKFQDKEGNVIARW